MKAIILDRFGPPEVLKLAEVETPRPGPDEVLIQVHAAGVNPVDCKTRAGKGVPVKNFPAIPGWDVSGTILTTGRKVTGFRTGDEVFGMLRFPDAGRTYAEYVTAPKSHIALKPAEITHEVAACAAMVALTNWQAMFEIGNLQPGQKLFIHGAAGGIGHVGVQLARLHGAEITCTASAKNHAFLLGLGADNVIDYTTQRFDEVIKDMDVVIDTRGGDDFTRLIKTVKKGGILVSLKGEDHTDEKRKQGEAQGIRVGYEFVKPDSELLNKIAGLLAEGKLKIDLTKTFPMEEAGAAHTMSEEGHVRGKIVLVNSLNN